MRATSNAGRWIFIGLVLLTLNLVALSGCVGRANQPAPLGPASAAPVATAGGVSLYLLDDPRLGLPQADRFMLDSVPTAGGIEITVRVVGAKRLRSCYCRLDYDSAQYAAQSAKAGPVWGTPQQLLSLAVLDQPGQAYFGAVLIHPQEQWGFEGDGVVARFTLGQSAAASALRTVSAPPVSDASKALLSWDAGTSTLSWDYTVQGDYNQDGEVGINDLTPLGIHFNELGPFDPTTAAFCVDGDANGEINIGDLTPIGANFQTNCLGGYLVYASADVADYPASNDATPLVVFIADLLLNVATGDPAVDRLHFEYAVPAPQANDYYWVRPADDNIEHGTPSTMVGGNPADVPVIAMVAPPGLGAGTAADPYWLVGDEPYALSVTSPSMGDVTNDPSTVYLVSDPGAGSIATSVAAVGPVFPFAGDFSIWAAYDNVSTANRIYVHVEPKYGWLHEVVDDGGPSDDNVGFYASAANISDQTCISYYNSTAQNLKYAQYITNVWHTMTVESAGDVGQHPSLMEFDGKAAIAYWDADNSALKLARATIGTPEQVSDWSIHTVKTPVEVGDISLALIGGRLAIAYHNFGSNRVEYARATVDVPAGETDWQIHQIEATEMCDMPRLHSVNAAPGLAFRAVESNKLIYARGTTAEPSSTADWIMMEVAPANITSLSIDDLDGLVPVLVYRDFDTDTLNIATSIMDPVDHTDWQSQLIAGGHGEGADCSVRAIHGHLCLAYQRLQSGSLFFAVADSPYPAAGDWQHHEVDSDPDVGQFCSLIGVGDVLTETPGIAYYDGANHELRFAWSSETW